jgi:hypothetical protein
MTTGLRLPAGPTRRPLLQVQRLPRAVAGASAGRASPDPKIIRLGDYLMLVSTEYLSAPCGKVALGKEQATEGRVS